jgi:hypothetical protein
MQETYKQSRQGLVKQDLVISAYKPNGGLEARFELRPGSSDASWDFVREHLRHLPVFVTTDRRAEVIVERQAFLLFDRMVAFHVQRGATVPFGAAEFAAGLMQRFPERDGMYFLPEQVFDYDKSRLAVKDVAQLELFVNDERTAIQWLRQLLGRSPHSYQDLQPLFLRELHQAVHEQLPELRDILEQNFLEDGQRRWYVPDSATAVDLEKLRDAALLKEFREYVADSRRRLKVFRTEAVRAGFKAAYDARDYDLIVRVADKLPEAVLQEDEQLLMYYDVASTRLGR